ncbi:threonine/serine exporter family protein [Lachnospiraceae bacterium 62-26]
MIHDFIMHVMCPFIGTIGYAVLFNIPKKFYLCCGFTGAAGWLIYHAVVSMNASAVTASFFGTLAVVLTSRVLSVRKKCPIIIFLVSGILPLVPGAGIYYTVYYMVTNQLAEAVLRGMESVKTAFAIVLGIVLVLSIPGGIFQLVSTEKGTRQRRG